MFCPKCGAELEDKDLFCWKCGQAAKQATATKPAAVQYEHCSIQGRAPGWSGVEWIALVDGKVIASRRYKTEGWLESWVPDLTSNRQARYHAVAEQALNELISELLSQGWEIFPPVQERTRTFRRVKKP